MDKPQQSGTPSARLREALKALGISQRKLALDLGERQQTVNRYMNGATPNSEFLGKLALLKNVSPLWILNGQGEMFIPIMGVPGVAPDVLAGPTQMPMIVRETQGKYADAERDTVIQGMRLAVSRIEHAWQVGGLPEPSRGIVGAVICILNAIPVTDKPTR